PGGGGAGGEDRGDAQLGATGEGEAVRGAVDRGVLLGGSDGGDPAAGAERGVVLARGRPGDAEGGGRSIPRGEHDRDPGGQGGQVGGVAVGAADDLAELRGEPGQERERKSGV